MDATTKKTCADSAVKNAKWVCFYGPGEEFLCAYTINGTFDGEMQATKELLAGEHGIGTDDITVRYKYKAP